jgi:glutamine synthetase
MILPAAIRYQTELANSAAALKSAGLDVPHFDLLKTVTGIVGDLSKAIVVLEKALGHHGGDTPYDHAKTMKEHVLPAMAEVRKHGDALEGLVADDLWPLPTYREMLFIK